MKRLKSPRWNSFIPFNHYDPALPLHEHFELQAALHPERVAVIGEGYSLTYEALDRKAALVALSIKNLGIPHRSVIGICLGRSPEVVIALLGILKAGCAYLPLDPVYPAERLRFITDDAAAAAIVTTSMFKERLSFSSAPLLVLDENPLVPVAVQIESADQPALPDGTAYVIYTSGTTGRPKGVCCHHRGVVNLLDDLQERQAIVPAERCSWWTNLSFDVSVYELFAPLLAGAAIVTVPDEVRLDAEALMEWLFQNRINSAYLPPMMIGHYHAWVREHPGASVMRRLLTGVEPIAEKLLLDIDALVPELQIINGYGPTETTICATLYSVSPQNETHTNTPLGIPVQNMHIHLLDERGDEVKEGERGEICISGIGVSGGYLNRPELNERLFTADPCSMERDSPMYRTGDVGTLLADGNLMFEGRKDFQVKYMGYRIEPGEIETVLRAHAALLDAIVILRGDEADVRRLVAYVVSRTGSAVSRRDLLDSMRRLLPSFMVPSAIVFLDALPMTSQGKIDRAALPPPERDDFPDGAERQFTPPESQEEKVIADIFSAVLGVGKVGKYDDFFALGGNSLLGTQVVSRLRVQLQCNISLGTFFARPAVNELAEEIAKQTSPDPFEAITPGAKERSVFPASWTQKGMWLFQQLHQEGTFFNIPVMVEISGPVNAQTLKRAFEALVARHESLRTTFEVLEGELVQRVLPSMPLLMRELDLSPLDADALHRELQRIRKTEGSCRFDPGGGPLFRVALITLGSAVHRLFITFHHLIIDGWGAGVFFSELAECYDAFSRNRLPALSPKEITYGDVSLWQRERLHGAGIARQFDYWKNKLKGLPFAQEIPADYARAAVQGFRGSRHPLFFSPESSAAIMEYCRQNNCTPYMFLMTVFQILVHRYSGRNVIITGTTVANRNHPQVEAIVGLFTNSLAIVTDFQETTRFADALKQVRDNSLEAFDHQDAPFEMLAEQLTGQHDWSRHPVFQNIFILQNTPDPVFQGGGIEFVYEEVGNETAKLDLLLNIEYRKGSFDGWIEYNTDLFRAATMQRIIVDYLWIANHALTESGTELSGWPLPSIPPVDETTMLPSAEEVATCHQMFELQAALNPDRTALLYDTLRITYRELNEKANRLAHALIEMGISAGVPVGLCVGRSPELFTGILGILKAGGAYVPLDPLYPSERIRFMIRDSAMKLAVTDSDSAGQLTAFKDIELVRLERFGRFGRLDEPSNPQWNENPQNRVGAENLAYIMYTSGSTGTPKGVMIKHAGVVNLARSAVKHYSIKESDRVLQFFSISFDGFVEELFMTLSCGATLVIRYFSLELSALEFLAQIDRQNITVLDLPTAFWHELVAGLQFDSRNFPSSLRLVIIGGEQASLKTYLDWKKNCEGRARLINTYGPTECSVVSLFCDPESLDAPDGKLRGLPIGRPMDNTLIAVVDERMQRVPFGMPGELLIGGRGVARGYLNREELTEEKFIHPFPDHNDGDGRFYRTGDLVRYLEDGTLLFIGRKDNQVKIRGYRIEPGEIESVLNRHEQVKSSAVIEYRDHAGQACLAAFIIPLGAAPDTAEVRQYLAKNLPEYMVPTQFIHVEKFPLLPNGKIDRNSFPPPERNHEKKESYEPPKSELEERLVAIWEEVLGIHPIGIRDDFFALGGHSLLAVRLCSRIQEAIKADITLSGLFWNLNIEALARKIEEKNMPSKLSSAVCIQPGPSPQQLPPLFFIHVLGTGLKFCRPMVQYLGAELPVYGLSVHLLENEPLMEKRVEAFARCYVEEVKNIQPEGPYLFAGISLGGLVAFEMAKRMLQNNEDVRLVALMDSVLPAAYGKLDTTERLNKHRQKLKSEGLPYLAKKLRERSTHQMEVISQTANHWFSNLLLRYYSATGKTGSMPIELKEFAARLDNDEAAMHYDPLPYEGKVTLFRSLERVLGTSDTLDEQLGWGSVALGGVEIIDCPSSHLGMLKEPHVRTVGQKLREVITRALEQECVEPESRDAHQRVCRSIKPGEGSLLREISMHALRESPDAFVATFDQMEHEPDSYWKLLADYIASSNKETIMLLCIEEQYVGYSAARIDPLDAARSHLRWMWIDPASRGQGLGIMLAGKILAWAKSKGALSMELWVSDRQGSAEALYSSLGFQHTGEHGQLRPGTAISIKKMVIDLETVNPGKR